MINPALVKLLGGACAVLVVVIAGEWWYWGLVNGEPENETGEVAAAYDELEFPQFQGDRVTQENYSDLVNRPLFIEGRRPAPEPEQQKSSSELSSETLDWELTGVYTVQQKPHVLLRRTKSLPNQKNHKKMPLDEEVDGWRLVEILPDKAILDRDGERKELILRKPKQKELPPGMRRPVPPRAPAVPQPPAMPDPPPPPPPEEPFGEPDSAMTIQL